MKMRRLYKVSVKTAGTTSVRGREEMRNLFIMGRSAVVKKSIKVLFFITLFVLLSQSLCGSVLEEEGVPREIASFNISLNHMASIFEF